jgi:hypothetical protein
MRHPLKKILVGSLGILLLSFLLFPSVAALTDGELDVWGSITALFTRMSSQEAKIADLEHKIDDLLDQLDTVKNPPEDVVEEPEDPQPEEPDPVDPIDPIIERSVKALWVEAGLKVMWTAASEDDFQGVKIVLSKNNSEPSYPDDGYLMWITDRKITSKVITPTSEYHGGDVGERLQPNTTYSLAITYVFTDKKITTDPIVIKTPSDFTKDTQPVDPKALILSVNVTEDRIKLMWTPEPSETLLGYKVVVSATNPNPSYPDDGYLVWITDWECSSTIIEADAIVNGGDIDGHLLPDTLYYAAITYLYADGKVTTEAVSFTTPSGFIAPEDDPMDPQLLTLSVEPIENVFKLTWTVEPASSLRGYKVVISETNATPSYPDDGYLTWITDPCTNTWIVNNSTYYNGGDLNGFLRPEATYTLVITYVYDDHSVTTQPVTITTPADFPITK